MANRKYLPVLLLFLLFTLPFLFSGCEKFKGGQDIPSYISIDSISLTTNYATQGTASQNITDAWVYLDDNLIGAFQLPVKMIPILANGKHKISVQPGIKKDGIGATRTNYVFYSTIERTVNLVEDSIVNMGTLNTTYQETTTFFLKEDFDGLAVKLDTTSSSEVGITLTPPGSPLTFQGNHSGMVVFPKKGLFFEAVNNEDFTIPMAPVYMELNFRSNCEFTVGVYLYGYTSIAQVPVLVLNPTGGQWKKIYIDLATALNSEYNMVNFRVFVGTYAGADNDTILMDNMKVVSRNASN
jgi:hypothetical protein